MNEQQLTSLWRYNAGSDAMVWQMMFTDNGDLIGQKRCLSKREAFFFALDTGTGNLFSDNYVLMNALQAVPAGEGWFTGLETTSGNLAYCYACQAYSPEHQGLWAIDFRCGSVVWQRSDFTFIANLGEALLVCKTSLFNGFPERNFLRIDPLTGSELDQFPLDMAQVNTLRAATAPEEVRQQIFLPDVVHDGMANAQGMLQRIGVSAASRCELLVHDSFTIVAEHQYSSSTALWHSTLQVWQHNQPRYCDVMEESALQPSLNTMLVRGAKLYYVKEKSELICVALS